MAEGAPLIARSASTPSPTTSHPPWRAGSATILSRRPTRQPWRQLTQATCSAFQHQPVPVIAPVAKRFAAFVTDGAISYLSWLPGLPGGPTTACGTWAFSNFLNTLFFLATGQTLGKWLFGIRQIVIQEGLDGKRRWEPLGVLKYIFNAYILRNIVMGITMGLSAVWPLFDANGQFPGDRLLGIFTVEASSLEGTAPPEVAPTPPSRL
eukprot:TRINITY_DN23520_c0_g1_i4.p1 TRINITY_DN23520_c0_g1~~TRINITY_DN23520_c0_g1_i4.p1  ORF type:complete len:208 (+),score=32.04 TRINITY_DN23520_c0_g1_i4:177-800(+)